MATPGEPLLTSLLGARIISVHGQPGTGKSLLAAQVALLFLDSGRSVDVVLLGQLGDAGRFLNQTMGIGMDLYSHLRTSALQLQEIGKAPTFTELCAALLGHPPSDVLLIDHLELVRGGTRPDDVEQTMSWLLDGHYRHLIFVSTGSVGLHRAFADVQIDLFGAARDLGRSHYDALVDIRLYGTVHRRSLRVAATTLELARV